MDDNIRKTVNALFEEHKDIHTVYALVCNAIDPIKPKEVDLKTKQYLEHLLAVEVMEENNWECDEFGKWHLYDKKKYAPNNYPHYIKEYDCWSIEVDGKLETGELEYVLGELCHDGLIYRFNYDVETHSHTHNFQGVLKSLLKNPEKFSVAGFESDYSEQELKFISKIQNELTSK